MSDLDPIPCDHLKSPDEPFHGDLGDYPVLKLLDYWRWLASCLMDNRMRGMLAEFLVAAACGLHTKPRVEWDSYDLCIPAGTTGLKIEVKSSAERQSWWQRVLSPLEFDIKKKKRWILKNGKWKSIPPARRWADLYVFCALEGADPDPMDVDAWQFYVLRRDVLDDKHPNQQKIRLGPLRDLSPHQCTYRDLKGTIEKVSGETLA